MSRTIRYEDLSYTDKALEIGDTIIVNDTRYIITSITYETTSSNTLPTIRYDAQLEGAFYPSLHINDEISFSTYRDDISIEHIMHPCATPDTSDSRQDNNEISDNLRQKFLELLEN